MAARNAGVARVEVDHPRSPRSLATDTMENQTVKNQVHRQSIAMQFLALCLLLISAGCKPSPGEVALQQFVGRTKDGTASVAVAKVGDKLLAYVCDSEQVGDWFEGSTGVGLVELNSRAGTQLILDSATEFSSGSFTDTDGVEHAFEISPAEGDEGLYLLFGQEPLDLSTRAESEVSAEELLYAALVEIATTQGDGVGEASFRAGWIVGKDGEVVGNITICSRCTTTIQKISTTSNILDLGKFVLASTGLSIEQVKEKIRFGRSLALIIGETGSTATVFVFNPCGDSFDLSVGGCCSCASFSTIISKISSGLDKLGIFDTSLNAFLDKLENGAAERLTDLCSSVNFNTECSAL